VQCSAVQCSAVQCSAVQCSAVQCSAVQWILSPGPTLQGNRPQLLRPGIPGACQWAVQCIIVQCSAVQCSVVQCSEGQCPGWQFGAHRVIPGSISRPPGWSSLELPGAPWPENVSLRVSAPLRAPPSSCCGGRLCGKPSWKCII
jgi:hypothetical protein